jgi:hypothetical protein
MAPDVAALPFPDFVGFDGGDPQLRVNALARSSRL